MRRRPQPSVRRGLLRAAGVVVGLTILLLVLIFIISTLTAPKAKAPTVPSTPTAGTPALTPSTSGTSTPGTHAKPTATSGAKKKKSSMMSGATLARRALTARETQPLGAVASPNGRFVLEFRSTGSAYARNPLVLLNRTTGAAHQVGFGDPFVRPVWLPDSSAFLYTRVMETSRFPGARWTLIRGDRAGHATVLAARNALAMTPLGWSGGRTLYLVGTAADTSLFAARAGRAPDFVGILLSQAVTGASLSPDGKTLAFSVPTGCAFCTVNLLDIDKFKMTYGPSGWGSELNLAWTPDSRSLVTDGRGGLAVVNVADGSARQVGGAKGLARIWPHAMSASVSGRVRLTDTVTGSTFTGGQ